MRTMALIATGLACIALLGAPPANAASADWSGRVYPLIDGAVDFENPIEGSKAAYTNGSRAVDFSVTAKGLKKGHGYTIWLMVFNAPENCVGLSAANGYRCGQNDHFNPAAKFSLMYGAGKWASGGSVRFEGTRDANTLLGRPGDVVVGPGLINPEGAEVHLRVRDHGPRQDCCGDEQVSTLSGGCTSESSIPGTGRNGDYACADVQATGS